MSDDGQNILDLSKVPLQTILVVDDAVNGHALQKVLEKKGFEVFVANDGGQTRTLLQMKSIDFLICETVLPRETGFELCASLKRTREQLPIMFLTEVDLDSARNLAIWCGADGYLTKPVGAERLIKMMKEVAHSVWIRFHAETEAEEGGEITFSCKCGHQLTVKNEHAGKAIFCPKCAHLAISPKLGVKSEGIWKSDKKASTDESGEGGGNNQLADFFCKKCSQILPLLTDAAEGQSHCNHCGAVFEVPKWIVSQRRFFFQPKVATTNETLINFNPSRYVMLVCPACSTQFSVEPSQLTKEFDCPACQHHTAQPSIRGVPLSRAAMASTGRLFGFTAGLMKGKKFLIPEDKEMRVGSGEKSHIQVKDPEISAVQFGLRWSDSGPWIIDKGVTKLPTFINDDRLEKHKLLHPGDVIRFGGVQLTLIGNRTLDEEAILQMSANDQGDDKKIGGVAESQIKRQAARIIQLHWEQQRRSMKHQPAASAQTATAGVSADHAHSETHPVQNTAAAVAAETPLRTGQPMSAAEEAQAAEAWAIYQQQMAMYSQQQQMAWAQQCLSNPQGALEWAMQNGMDQAAATAWLQQLQMQYALWQQQAAQIPAN